MTYSKRTVCRAWITLALTLAAAAPCSANQALANKAGCLGCHAKATQLLGPSYQAVAARYQGDTTALAKLTQRIREGGVGAWGDVAMPPQPNLSPADTRRLAQWILGGAK